MIEYLGHAPQMPDGTPVPFSQGTKANGFVFVAGQMGIDKDVKLAGPDIEAQTEMAIDNMEAVLAEAGLTLKDVVKANIFITDVTDFAGFNKVYAKRFGAPFPARATVITALLIPGAKVEIEAIAVAP